MSDVWDDFFIRKINEGLSISSQRLSPDEERQLRTPVLDLLRGAAPFSPEEAKKLQAKCIGALVEAYARDTATKNHNTMLLWRQMNASLLQVFNVGDIRGCPGVVSQRGSCTGKKSWRLHLRGRGLGWDSWSAGFIPNHSGVNAAKPESTLGLLGIVSGVFITAMDAVGIVVGFNSQVGTEIAALLRATVWNLVRHKSHVWVLCIQP